MHTNRDDFGASYSPRGVVLKRPGHRRGRQASAGRLGQHLVQPRRWDGADKRVRLQCPFRAQRSRRPVRHGARVAGRLLSGSVRSRERRLAEEPPGTSTVGRFLDRTVTLQDNPAIQTVRAPARSHDCRQGTNDGQFGQADRGPLPLFYESTGPSKDADFVKGPAFWYTARTGMDAHGNFTARLAKGPKLVGGQLFISRSIPTMCLSVSLTKYGPWQRWRQRQAGGSGSRHTRYHDRPRQIARRAGPRGWRGRQDGGGRRCRRAVRFNCALPHRNYAAGGRPLAAFRKIEPEEEINVTASAPGYKPQSEMIELFEGEVVQLDIMLKPPAATASDDSDKPAVTPAERAPVAAVPPPATSVQTERPHYYITGGTITFTEIAIDADLAILDKHPELKTVDLGGAKRPWDGPDPQLFPIKIPKRGLRAHRQLHGAPKSCSIAGFTTTASSDRRWTEVDPKALSSGFASSASASEPFTSLPGLSHLAGLTNLEELDLFDPSSDSSRYDDATARTQSPISRSCEH